MLAKKFIDDEINLYIKHVWMFMLIRDFVFEAYLSSHKVIQVYIQNFVKPTPNTRNRIELRIRRISL